MKWGWFKGKNHVKENSLEDSENLANLLVALSGKWDTPALIAYLADERARLLLCKALVSPVSGSDRQLAQRANQILRNRGLDPDQLKKRLEPAAVALGLGSTCDIQIDYYDVLSVKPSATSSELRAAYRKKAFEIHPDTAGETRENLTDFVTLKAAYDTLMEPNSRAAFDQCQAQLDSWYEEDPEESSGEGAQKRSPGRRRKAAYRVAAVVAVMVAIAWVLSIMYERETMLELVQVTASNEPGPAREMVEPAAVDTREVEKKAPVPVLSEVVQDKVAPKKPATAKPVLEKPVPEKPGPEKPVAKKLEPKKLEPKKLEPKKLEQGPLKTAALVVPEPVPATEPVETQAKLPPEPTEEGPTEETKPVPDVKTEDKGASEKPKVAPAPAPEPVETTALPSTKPEKKQAPVVRESLKEKPKEVLKPVRVKVMEIPEATKKKQPAAAVPVRWVVPEKPAESPVQEMSIPPNSSVQAATGSPVKAFPEIPLPKTHKTPFIERSQVLAFLKKYTAAYERGNAETFFSYFTVNAVENGKPLVTFKPDYLEIWDKVQSLDYRIIVNELNQFVGSNTVSMKGRFDLDWKFRNGRSGQSRGDISMDLTLNESALRVSRLNYRFDGEK